MEDYINSINNAIFVEWKQKIDDVIFGEIKNKVLENGIITKITLSEKDIISAIKKQIPKKIKNLDKYSDITACIPNEKSGNCPICNNFMIGEVAYCKECGQALDWGESEQWIKRVL